MFAAQILSARIEVRSSICESRYLDHKRWTFTVQPLQACCTNSNRLPRSKKHNIQETQFFNLVFCEVQLACDIRICQSIAQRTIDGKKYAQSRSKSTHCALLSLKKLCHAWLKEPGPLETFRFSCIPGSHSALHKHNDQRCTLTKTGQQCTVGTNEMGYSDDRSGFWVNSGVRVSLPLFPEGAIFALLMRYLYTVGAQHF